MWVEEEDCLYILQVWCFMLEKSYFPHIIILTLLSVYNYNILLGDIKRGEEVLMHHLSRMLWR